METIIEFLNGNILPFAFNRTVSEIAILAGIAVFNSFLIFCYQMFGITDSISKIYYEFPSAENDFLWSHNTRWVFQLFMLVCLLCISLITQRNIFYIVSLFFLLMTLNPSVNAGNIYFIPHIIGAVSAIVLAHVGLVVCYGLWWIELATLLMLVGVVILSRRFKALKEKIIYVVEFISIQMMIAGLAIGTNLQ